MNFETEKIHNIIIVKLQGALEVSIQTLLKEKLQDIAAQNDNDVVLDFSNVEFIDSACLGALVALLKRLREHKGDIKMACLTDDVRSIFQITRLDRVFDLFETKEEAVNSFFK